VLGCFCLTVPTYGLLSSIGLFQTYWHGSVLAGGGHSESDVAWIISVFGFLDCLFAAPAGILFDRGHGWLLPLGCAVYVVAFVGLACSRTYAQFMGCMAVAGVAAGGYYWLVHGYRDSFVSFLCFFFSLG
jgi:MFS family permease